MIQFTEIQKAIDADFMSYMEGLFGMPDEPLKYYYWSLEFFEIVGGLSFTYFELSEEDKDKINQLGQSIFNREDIDFEVNKNSQRHDLSIRNYHLLFSEKNKSGQTYRYEYVKEFILWKILLELKFDQKIIKAQKQNFVLTYLKHLLQHIKGTPLDFLNRYIKYTLTGPGQTLLKKLDVLDGDGVHNDRLRNKIDRLFVLRECEPLMRFVFSRQGGGDKEELRELLDIMGDEGAGSLYRGQANALWQLDASILREENYRAHESELYYDILTLKPDAFERDHTVYERLITMQHFGMPTRLLDVTRNPLVAIFFACNNRERWKNDGVIYTFNPEKSEILNFDDSRLKCLTKLVEAGELRDICRTCEGENKCFVPLSEETAEEVVEKLSDDFKKNWFVRGLAKNQRINSQSGDFIFAGVGKAEKELPKLPELTIVIDAPTKEVLLQELETLNIHGGAVYPDLTHMSNYIKNKYAKVKFSRTDIAEVEIDQFFAEMIEKAVEEKSPQDVGSIVERKDGSFFFFFFDENEFWTQENKDKVHEFAIAEGLREQEFIQLLNHYYNFDSMWVRSDVAKIMIDRPRIKQYKAVVEPLMTRIKEFADNLKAE